MFGIDLGSKYIKVCKFVGHENDSPLSILCAMKSVKNTVDDQSKSVTDILNELKIKENYYISVNSVDTISRNIVLPKSIKQKDMDSAVMTNIEQTVQEDLNKMFKSYLVTKEISDKENNILFIATPKKRINERIQITNEITNSRLVGVSTDSIALTNAFNLLGPDYKSEETIILVNIGDVFTNMVVLHKKEIVFMKDISFGGSDMTKEIASLYAIPQDLAERSKKIPISDDLAEYLKRNDDLWDKVGLSMKGVFKKSSANLLETVFRTIEYCITRQAIVSVDRIVLTGGGSVVKGLDVFIKDTLGIPTEKWNPFENNEVHGLVKKEYGYFMPVALGLALEKDNG
ncbi:MAG: pilus assembly protein PilM [Endomicrobiaceae bacterium]|nr:pilus assembly protein PilM [Endomicrobiaceae bacterium]